MKTYSLYELNEYLLRVIALNFSESVWITAEIGQCKGSQGHIYTDLLQKENDDIIAQMRGVIWAMDLRKIKQKLGGIVEDILTEGMEIRFKGRVDFHERYGLKIIIEDIDATYTIGKLQIARQHLIQELQKKGLIGKNAALPLPSVIQKIAVISSETAAGWLDFKKHLAQNPFGYAFSLYFFQSAMQGAFVEKEMLAQLHKIQLDAEQYDCVVIIRGGGAKLDLVAFDTPSICKAVAAFPLPVFTGIGHDIDQTVLDMVAHSSLKTPTAVADFILNHNLRFDSLLNDIGRFIQNYTQNRLSTEGVLLSKYADILLLKTQNLLEIQHFYLKNIENDIQKSASLVLKYEKTILKNAEQIVDSMSIERTLRRGFTITRKNGKIAQSKQDLKEHDVIETEFFDGVLKSKIE